MMQIRCSACKRSWTGYNREDAERECVLNPCKCRIKAMRMSTEELLTRIKENTGNRYLNLLKYAIIDKVAVATHFEEAIVEQGLTMELIALISEYYRDNIDADEKIKAKEICGTIKDLKKVN